MEKVEEKRELDKALVFLRITKESIFIWRDN